MAGDQCCILANCSQRVFYDNCSQRVFYANVLHPFLHTNVLHPRALQFKKQDSNAFAQ